MGEIKMKREPLFTWYEKLSMYFVGLVVMAFIIVIGDVKAAREKNEKIQECVQFLEEENHE
jgi:hypothetical protein|tara:strand:+ start:632 stop:814 length:183 start_codon:yes stop_codon:yes gene_type:complete